MIRPIEDRTPPLTPQLALRVAIVGGVALVVFAIIFFRLWVLQVLTGNQYTQQAQANDARAIAVLAPRGAILDRSGTVMVKSQPVPSVQISAPALPDPVSPTLKDLSYPTAANQTLYNKLGHVLGMPSKRTGCQYKLWIGPKPHREWAKLSPIACLVAQGVSQYPYAKVTIKSGVSSDVQAYLAEHQGKAEHRGQFPGVVSQEVSERKYPLGTVAAQLFGTIGPVSKQEENWGHFKGVPDTDIVGQSGLEYEYDKYLLGTDGYEKAKVDAQGAFEGWEKGKTPIAGDNVQLSIDLAVQRAGERSLAESISKNPPADGGAFVALNPDNGQVYAMGSNPTFNPSVFTKPMTQKQYDRRFGVASGSPLLNRAIQSVGPDGSTFKPITATAALESGVVTPGYVYDDATGKYCIPGSDPKTPGDCPQNSGGQPYGPVDLESAIKFSVDTYFYRLGYLLNSYKPQGGALQKWAKAFGIGRRTGIDLPGEASGTRPSPAWVQGLDKLQAKCVAKHHKQYRTDPSVCQIASGGSWVPGDSVHMAVGQGDVQVSPLQLAVAYAAIANGGTIVTPHVGEDIQSPSGTIIQKIDPRPKRKLDIQPSYLQAIQTGLYEAAHDPGGTSADVMGNFPEAVYGKTGTAQYFNAANVETDYSWYACYVPASATSKPIVVVAWVEKGGFGAVAAAPVARQILSQWFKGKPGPFVSGNSKTL